jgi:hypothetical protein
MPSFSGYSMPTSNESEEYFDISPWILSWWYASIISAGGFAAGLQRINESQNHITAVVIPARYGGLYDLGLMLRIPQIEPRFDLNRETLARLFDQAPDFIRNSHPKPENNNERKIYGLTPKKEMENYLNWASPQYGSPQRY